MAFKSELAHLVLAPESPFELFSTWRAAAQSIGSYYSDAMCLATINKAGELGNRTVLLRRMEEDGFIISTTRDGKKYKDLTEVPKAAVTFLWRYLKDGIEYTNQVRTQCNAVELTQAECLIAYEPEPFFCKVRAHLCKQSHPVEWEDLKKRHDDIVDLAKASGTEDLPIPECFAGFKLIPYSFDFYYSETDQVADRVLYELKNGVWNHHHVEA